MLHEVFFLSKVPCLSIILSFRISIMLSQSSDGDKFLCSNTREVVIEFSLGE